MSEKTNRRWSAKDEDYLSRYWGCKSISHMARRLHRSCDAVYTKGINMGLGRITENVDGIPMMDIPEIVGRPYQTIRRTWVDAGLKTYKCGRGLTYVKEDDLKEFMQEHTNLWDARECDYYYFYADRWFMKILDNERNGIHADRYHKWSDLERAKFIHMREVKAMTFKEIAEEFGISEKNAWKRYKCWKKQSEREKKDA